MLKVNPQPDESDRKELSSADLLVGSPTWGPVLRVGQGVLAGLLLLIALAAAVTSRQKYQSDQMRASSNARQIAGLLLAFAAENGSNYPDSFPDPATDRPPETSNAVFRALFREGLTQEEKIFGCPRSAFVPDGEVGVAPDYAKALTKGENHWAMTTGLASVSSDKQPLIFEDPAVASWPPVWKPDAKGKPAPGRAWGNRTIIVILNDASLNLIQLTKDKAGNLSVPENADGGNPFTQGGETLKVLDVEE